MRLFFAVELPDEVRQGLAHGLGALKRQLPAARWVRVDGMHVTLKFLGEQPAAIVDRLAATVTPATAPLPPVEVRLGGGGFFPHERRPRVAWVGGTAAGLDNWALAVEEACASLGLEREPRPFSLHLTLARLEHPWAAPVVERFLAEVARWQLPAFTAREVVLFASELQPTGAVYTALRRFPTGG
jgi:2'-5' RNA ligase